MASTNTKKFIKSFTGIFGRSALEEEATQEVFEGIPVVRMVACPLNKKHTPEFMKHTKYVYVSNCLGAYLRSNSMACLAWERPLLLKTKVVLLLSILVNRHVVLSVLFFVRFSGNSGQVTCRKLKLGSFCPEVRSFLPLS